MLTTINLENPKAVIKACLFSLQQYLYKHNTHSPDLDEVLGFSLFTAESTNEPPLIEPAVITVESLAEIAQHIALAQNLSAERMKNIQYILKDILIKYYDCSASRIAINLQFYLNSAVPHVRFKTTKLRDSFSWLFQLPAETLLNEDKLSFELQQALDNNKALKQAKQKQELEHRQRLVQLQNQINENVAPIVALKGDNQMLQQNYHTLQQNYAALENLSKEFEKTMTENNQNLAGVEDQLEAANQTIKNLEIRIDELIARIIKLEKDANLPSSINMSQENLEQQDYLDQQQGQQCSYS